jgi:MFS family permease
VSTSPYRVALTAPGAVAPALFSALGRFPVAMYGMAVLLYVQVATGSFADAGLVSAGSLVGVAAGSVVQGRWVDRSGPTRPLLIVTGLFGVAVTGLFAAVETGAGTPVLVAAAVLTGVLQPALTGASRALWGRLVPPGAPRAAAYNYEAISMEVFFILGPGLAAVLVAAPWPGTGLLVAAVAAVVGTAGFALTAAVRAPIPPTGNRLRLGPLGALARPGVRTVALAGLGFGLVVGGVEVAVPAVTTAAGSQVLGGVLISAWSIVSVAAGVVYALRPWPRPLHQRLPALLGAFAVVVAAMATAAGSLLALAVVMLASGAFITAQLTAQSLALEIATPDGAATEAFGWTVTAITLGLAAGQSTAGWAVESAGPWAAFLTSGSAGVALAAVLWTRRGTLVPAPVPEVAHVG